MNVYIFNQDQNYFVRYNLFYLMIQDVQILCDFGSYDLNDDEVIFLEEFLSVIVGLIKIDFRMLFECLDINGNFF